jgi:hypothetical protein
VGYAAGPWTAGASHPAYLSFETAPQGSITRQERLRIGADGNVGIGTTNPTQRLHVEGNARITGDLLLGVSRFLSVGPTYTNKSTYVGASAGAGAGSSLNNTAVGYNALLSSSIGSNNTAVGQSALGISKSGSNNCAFGVEALMRNSSGSHNIAIGYNASWSNDNGNSNIAIGTNALYSNTAGSYNVAIGERSLNNTRSSQYNTAVGYRAGSDYDNGWNNVFVGANTGPNNYSYYNVIAIGQGAVCTAPSQVTIGNSATSSYRVYASWSNISDRRFKQDVQEAVPGLSFINKLRPVTYRLKAASLNAFLREGQQQQVTSVEAKAVMQKALREKEVLVQTGFIAQEVEEAAKELGYNFSGVDVPANTKDVYALKYAEFVVPLVKAVQELDEKTRKIEDLEARIEKLEALLTRKSTATSVNITSAYLEQNAPNPVNISTTIRYYVPDGATSARLTLTNTKGQLLKNINLTSRGMGQLQLETYGLATGTYHYSLWVDGREAAIKQLLITR